MYSFREPSNAQTVIDSTQKYLSTLRTTLEELIEGIKTTNNDELSPAVREHVTKAVKNSGQFIFDADHMLQGYNPMGFLQKVRWALGGSKKIGMLCSNLATHQSSLNVFLHLITLSTTKSHKLATDTAFYRAEDDKQLIKERLDQIYSEIFRLRSYVSQNNPSTYPSNDSHSGNIIEHIYPNEKAFLEDMMRERLMVFGFPEGQVDSMISCIQSSGEQQQPSSHETKRIPSEIGLATWKIEKFMRMRLLKSGFTEGQMEMMINPQLFRELKRTPIYVKIAMAHIELASLAFFKLPWDYDEAHSDYIVILKELDDCHVDLLFEHTRCLRGMNFSAFTS